MTLKSRLLVYAGAVLLIHVLSACETESQEPSAAQNTINEVQRKYDELLKDKVDVPVE